eukprot:TRINITY_DN8192_c0_g1_i1.p1 TRINITY_DN8192_c0_g1~~TRINITY_DN8192_c0_g1_i1.p1  ORF type:complete len:301 (-),score=60.54 TRINITY_DN8192_c0_g1_i1:168-1070(-)
MCIRDSINAEYGNALNNMMSSTASVWPFPVFALLFLCLGAYRMQWAKRYVHAIVAASSLLTGLAIWTFPAAVGQDPVMATFIGCSVALVSQTSLRLKLPQIRDRMRSDSANLAAAQLGTYMGYLIALRVTTIPTGWLIHASQACSTLYTVAILLANASEARRDSEVRGRYIVFANGVLGATIVNTAFYAMILEYGSAGQPMQTLLQYQCVMLSVIVISEEFLANARRKNKQPAIFIIVSGVSLVLLYAYSARTYAEHLGLSDQTGINRTLFIQVTANLFIIPIVDVAVKRFIFPMATNTK